MSNPNISATILSLLLAALLPLIAACDTGSDPDDPADEGSCCTCWCTQAADEVVLCSQHLAVTKEDSSSCEDVCATTCGDTLGCSAVHCSEDFDCNSEGGTTGTPCGFDRCASTEPHVDVIYPSTSAEFELGESVPFLVSVTDDDPDLIVQWTDDLYGDVTVMDVPPITAADTYDFMQDGFEEGIHIVRIRALDSNDCLGGDDVPFCMGEPPI